MQTMNIAIIGAGNVATHLAVSLKKCGHNICGIYSRTFTSADTLAKKVDCLSIQRLEDLPEADFYIFSITDQNLPQLIENFKKSHQGKGIWIHTAGSVDMNVFEQHHTQYGVVYPMQTFSKNKELTFKDIPLFIEASDDACLQKISALAKCLSTKVEYLPSKARGQLHIAAVFACNFTNHCYAIAEELLKENGLSPHLLWPLIEETTQKIHLLPALEGQTGPAIRKDYTILQQHYRLLAGHPIFQNIYQLMSDSIQKLAASSEIQKKQYTND